MVETIKPLKESSKLEQDLNNYLNQVKSIVLKYDSDSLRIVDISAKGYQYRLLESRVQQEFAARIASTLRAFIGPMAASDLEKELSGL